MKTIHTLFVFVLLLVPGAVFAHATPIDMQPRSGAQLQVPANEIAIRFSERLEPRSSLIRVTDESGVRVDNGTAVVGEDERMLTIPVQTAEGIYTVAWSVVSKDDGHFTRGSYAFSIGARVAPTATSEEVVHIASIREAGLMFVEFVGNSILWGILALYLLSGGDTRLRRILSILALYAAVAAIIGACGQLALKAHELAGLHGIGFMGALDLYVHTAAGSSTAIRGTVLALGGTGAALFAFRSVKRTVVLLAAPLFVFAYFRAIISHATANPFYPELSIGVNFVHVIEKDLWLGTLFVLSVLAASRVRKTLVPELVPRALSMLSANLAVLAASAGYIVWLHLKGFSNLMSTSWGQAFLPLMSAAVILVALHSYHVLALRYRPRFFERFFLATLGAETAAAVLVVFFSSVVIITSPPLHTAPFAYTAIDQGTTISLSRAPYEDGSALLTITGEHDTPTVFIGEREGGLKPALTKRFEGGYTFPAALVGEHRVTIIVQRPGAYDVQALFEPRGEDFRPPEGHGRTIDRFTLVILGAALAGIALAVFLRRFRGSTDSILVRDTFVSARITTAALLSLIVMLAAMAGVSKIFDNRFKATCLADGNMWHLMQPTRAGVSVSDTAYEGCMWGMGAYPYLFADRREYNYLGSLGPATVSLSTAPATPHTGSRADLNITLKNADDSPATLLVDMEKYVHVVIVSEDQSVFAHVHPDDNRELTQAEIDSSTFTVPFTFPKAGRYLVSVDYAHGTQLESKQFAVEVTGGPAQDDSIHTYSSPGLFDGYEVSMDGTGSRAGEVTTLRFRVSHGGNPVTIMEPYLAAVAHISVVKNDSSAFMHTHGEIHAPGTPYQPIIVKNGTIIHSMETMIAPLSFGPNFEAHVLFPTPGRYTVWAQFKVQESVIPASFTIDVE